MSIPTNTEVTTWLGVIGTAVVAALAMWVRASKANATVKKQNVEGDLYERLVKERDDAMRDAREAWATRTHDAEQIARLIAREEALRNDMVRLRDEFSAWKRMILRRFPEAADFMPSNTGTLDEAKR